MNALVLGAGGFIGSHMVKRLKSEGHWVRGVDLKYPEFSETEADEFLLYDLRVYQNMKAVLYLNEQKEFCYRPIPFDKEIHFDEVYQFAADMGGAGFVFTGEHDAEIMHNSAQINLNLCELATTEQIFYSSSACIYPEGKQLDPDNPGLKESDAYPANPDSDYGWEKLFSERLYQAFHRNKGLDIRIARFHNIYGPYGTYEGGREKAPAAMCRKVIDAKDYIEIWGNGKQTRSFLYIDDCIKAVRKLMNTQHMDPINIGSEEMVEIQRLAQMAINISGKDIRIKNIDGPIGVMGRNSDNTEVRKVLNWNYETDLTEGLFRTYKWIEERKKQS